MINTSIGLIGLARQSDKRTPAAEPTFTHGLTGGKVFSLERSVANASVSCGVRAGTDAYVESVKPGLDFDTYGYSDALPLYMLAAMGNISSTAGDEPGTFKHVVTLGDALPYLTFWGRIGSEYTRTDGCKVDQLELEFEGNKPLAFGITAIGMDAELGLAAIPGDPDPSCFDGYYVPTGGTFKVDTASGTPALAPVKAGSLTLANSCAADQLAGEVMPGDVEEGKLVVSGSVTTKPDDLAQYRKMVTGSETGTKPSGKMVYGSFEWVFEHSKNPKHKLTISSGRVPFTAEFPEVNPDGGGAEVEYKFDDIGVDSPNGSPVVVTIVNETESYL